MSTNRQAAIAAVQLSEFLRGYHAAKKALEAVNEEPMPEATEKAWRPLYLHAWCLSAWPWSNHTVSDIAIDLEVAGRDLSIWYRRARARYGHPHPYGGRG